MIGKLINMVIGRPVGVIIGIKCGAILRKGGGKGKGGAVPFQTVMKDGSRLNGKQKKDGINGMAVCHCQHTRACIGGSDIR